SIHRAPRVEFLPNPLRLPRIFANEHLLEAHSHRMRARRLDGRTRDPRVHVRLADPRDSLVSVHHHHDVVLCGRSRIGAKVGNQQYVAFDVGDFHGMISCSSGAAATTSCSRAGIRSPKHASSAGNKTMSPNRAAVSVSVPMMAKMRWPRRSLKITVINPATKTIV